MLVIRMGFTNFGLRGFRLTCGGCYVIEEFTTVRHETLTTDGCGSLPFAQVYFSEPQIENLTCKFILRI